MELVERELCTCTANQTRCQACRAWAKAQMRSAPCVPSVWGTTVEAHEGNLARAQERVKAAQASDDFAELKKARQQLAMIKKRGKKRFGVGI